MRGLYDRSRPGLRGMTESDPVPLDVALAESIRSLRNLAKCHTWLRVRGPLLAEIREREEILEELRCATR